MTWITAIRWGKYYEVNYKGQVRRKACVLPHWRGGTRQKPPKIIKGTPNKDGYLTFTPCTNNTKTNCFIHRIVAETLIPNPEGKPQINHKNGIKSDNRVENLEWCTQDENMRHSYRQLGRVHPRGNLGNSGEKSKSSKPVKQINKSTFETVGVFHSMRQAEQETGIDSGLISMAANGKLKTGGGYIWQLL